MELGFLGTESDSSVDGVGETTAFLRVGHLNGAAIDLELALGAVAVGYGAVYNATRVAQQIQIAFTDCHIIPRYNCPSAKNGSTGEMRGQPSRRSVPTSASPVRANCASPSAARSGSAVANSAQVADMVQIRGSGEIPGRLSL